MLPRESPLAVRLLTAGSLLHIAVATAHSQPAFTEAAALAGIDMTHDWPPNYIPGLAYMMAGGAAGDFNDDGWQDLFVVSGGVEPDKLYINNQDGTFTDEAAAWGLTDLHMGAGAAVGDFNNDGRLDIFVASYGDPSGAIATGQHRLYRNNGGTFTEVAVAAGVNWSDTVANAFGGTFGDYDLDGDLDLHITGWFTHGSGGNRLFRNNGDETFTDVTVAAGMTETGLHGYSARFVDMDGDRWPELLLAADFGTARYYVNNRDGTFTNYTGPSGTGLDHNAMGATIGDFNNDGRFDWYVTNIWRGDSVPEDPCGNMLYINQGGHTYVEQSVAAGVNHGYWGWGTVAVDFDHDTLQDLFEVNGWDDDDFNQVYENRPARVWRNNGDGTFTEMAATCGFDHIGQGRGLVNFDADNDGDQDFVVFSAGEPLEYYRNDGPTGNWLRVLLDTDAVPGMAPNGVGSHVRITIAGQQYHRTIDGGSNYLSQSELSAHFGLGAATTVDQLLITWPNGARSRRVNVAANQTVTIRAPGASSASAFPRAAQGMSEVPDP